MPTYIMNLAAWASDALYEAGHSTRHKKRQRLVVVVHVVTHVCIPAYAVSRQSNRSVCWLSDLDPPPTAVDSLVSSKSHPVRAMNKSVRCRLCQCQVYGLIVEQNILYLSEADLKKVYAKDWIP